jgi:hypothetical protein
MQIGMALLEVGYLIVGLYNITVSSNTISYNSLYMGVFNKISS